MDNVCSGGEGFCDGGGSGVMCSNDLLTRQEDPQLGLLGGIFLLERLVLAISPPPFLFCHPNGTVPGVGNLNCEEGCWWVVLRPSLHLNLWLWFEVAHRCWHSKTKKYGFNFSHVCHFCPHYVHLLISHTCNKNAAYPCRYFTMCKKNKASSCCQETKNNLIFPTC
jgi:hypothetical protein